MRVQFPTRQIFLRKMLQTGLMTARSQAGEVGTHFGGRPQKSTIQEWGQAKPLSPEGMDALSDTDASTLFSSVAGIDVSPRPMSNDEIVALGDVFTERMLCRGVVPLTLRDLLDAIEALAGPDGLPKRNLFLVGEGGRHALDHPGFHLNGRLVYSWSRGFDAPDLFLSTVPSLDDPESLMQLVAWSEADRSFHFFERLMGHWFWAGNSFHALDPRSRGKGPFDSHINGGLVMKELKAPWAHWHSQSSSIPRELLSGTDFGKHPGLNAIEGAEVLETITMAGVRRWTQGRIRRDVETGQIHAPSTYINQILTATSGNLVSAKEEYRPDMTQPVTLPKSFFLDVDGLVGCARRLSPTIRLVPDTPITVAASDYVEAIDTLDIGIQAVGSTLRVRGDTHFCFLVPERAFEDTEVLRQIIAAEWISARFALCLLLVDFANPVGSTSRASLSRHAPEKPISIGRHVLDDLMLEAIEKDAVSGSPEMEFLEYWRHPDVLELAKAQIEAFVAAIVTAAASRDGVMKIMQLAEARRRDFRARDLHEFSATTAHSTADIGNWWMTKAGAFVSESSMV